MRTDELRDVLRTHAEDVAHTPASARVGQVRGRVAAVRRRRAAVAGGGVVAAVAVTALAVLPNLGTPAPAPAGPPEGVMTAEGYTKDGVTYRAEVLGEKLLGAAIGDPGESTVSFAFVVGEEGLRFSPLCYGAGRDLMVTYEVSGDPVGAIGCGRRADPDPGAGGSTFEAPPEKMLIDWGLEPGDTATVTVRLVSVEDSQGATVEHPAAVVGVGVYTDTRETRVVAGAEVPERVEHEGRVWELQSTYESVRGHEDIRVFTGRRGAQEDTLVGVAVSGLGSPSSWDIRLDGEVAESAERRDGADGPVWRQWQSFAQGDVYDVRLVVTEGLTARTRLAFLSYTPVG